MLNRFEQFSSVIFGIHRYIQKLERDEMIKYGYKGAFAQYLVILSEHPEGLIASRICEICDKDKAAVSRIVSEMQEKGLLVRECNENHVYRGVLKLTEKGHEVAKHVCEKARAAVLAISKEAMNDEERAIFYTIIERISAKLHSFTKEGSPQSFT